MPILPTRRKADRATIRGAIRDAEYDQRCSVRLVGSPPMRAVVWIAIAMVMTPSLAFAGHLEATAVASLRLKLQGDAAVGYLRASWDARGPGVVYELQQANTAEFVSPELRYRGPHNASVLSGLPDGRFYLRVRAIVGQRVSAWSKVEEFTVRHHPRSLAWLFLLAGAAVFSATLTFLVFFARRSPHG